MPDCRTDADRFGDWLDDAPSGRPDDDLARFAAEVLRLGSLPSSPPLTEDQRARIRIRARVTSEAVMTIPPQETPTMTPHAFSANGSGPVALPTPPIDHPSPSWPSLLTTAALVLIIGIAAFALARGPLDLIPTGDGPAPTGAPAIMQAPDATPLPTGGCDLTEDIPVVTGPDVLPFERTLLVHEGDTLALHCAGARTVVAEGITGVRGTGWPGAVIVTMTDGTLRGINLITGASGDLGPGTMPAEDVGERLFLGAVSRWLLMPTDADLSDWRLVDLLMMEMVIVSDVPGASLPDRSIAFPRSSASETTLVVSFYEEDPSPTTGSSSVPTPDADTTGIPVLVVDGSLDTVRWTEVAPGYIAGASLSPDGDLLALTRETEGGLTVDVQRTSDGDVVVETGIALDVDSGDDFLGLYGDDFLGLYGDDQVLVLDNEAGLLHLTRFRLDLVTWNDAGETETTTLREFAADEGAPQMFGTADPAIVIVAMGYGDIGRNAYRVDVTTGATTELTNLIGETVEPISNSTTPLSYVLVAAPAGGDRSTLQLVDATTGHVAVESDPVDLPIGDLNLQSAQLVGDGATGLVSIGPDRALLLDARVGESFIIDAPTGVDGVPEGTWWYFFAGDDGFITATPEAPSVTSLFIRENDPDAEWVEVSPESLIGIVPGADATVEP